MKKSNLLSCLLLFMSFTLFISCEKDDDGGGGGSEKGWIKYAGQTYKLTRAAAVSQVQSFPGYSGHGYTVRVCNNDMTNDLMFGFYSNASTLQTATGTYTMYRGQPEPGTMSNIVTSGVLGGEPFYWPGSLTNVGITVSHSNGTFKIEGTWTLTNGTVEIYYNGQIDIQ